MTKKEISKKIELLVERKKAIDKTMAPLYNIFGESKIEEVVWETYDELLVEIEQNIGDVDQATSFYIFDCNCGEEKPMVALHYPKFKKPMDVAKYILSKK